jgi:hypothetical protein
MIAVVLKKPCGSQLLERDTAGDGKFSTLSTTFSMGSPSVLLTAP